MMTMEMRMNEKKARRLAQQRQDDAAAIRWGMELLVGTEAANVGLEVYTDGAA